MHIFIIPYIVGAKENEAVELHATAGTQKKTNNAGQTKYANGRMKNVCGADERM